MPACPWTANTAYTSGSRDSRASLRHIGPRMSTNNGQYPRHILHERAGHKPDIMTGAVASSASGTDFPEDWK